MTKFRGKYRIKSSRLLGWDYGKNAIYFVTICTKNRHHFFGEIIHGKMNLSGIGEIADKCWLEIPEHFPFVILHDYIVMPNHVHGLIEIAKNDIINVETQYTVETQCIASLPIPIPIPTQMIHKHNAMYFGKTNSARNPKIYHLLFGDLKSGLPKMRD